MRYTLADANDARDFDFEQRLDHHKREVESRLLAFGARISRSEKETGYAYRVTFNYDGELRRITDVVENVPNVECSRSGIRSRSSRTSATPSRSPSSTASTASSARHGIGHFRMATESDVDISGAPYWAYPFGDVAVVHNRAADQLLPLEAPARAPAATASVAECDSEVIAVYLAEKMSDGYSLEDAMRESLEELDGVFTYICVTGDALGVAKTSAGEPLVLYEADDIVSARIRRRSPSAHPSITRSRSWDPYEGEVMVWTR